MAACTLRLLVRSSIGDRTATRCLSARGCPSVDGEARRRVARASRCAATRASSAGTPGDRLRASCLAPVSVSVSLAWASGRHDLAAGEQQIVRASSVKTAHRITRCFPRHDEACSAIAERGPAWSRTPAPERGATVGPRHRRLPAAMPPVSPNVVPTGRFQECSCGATHKFCLAFYNQQFA